MFTIKITCLTPKGKAEQAMGSTARWLSLTNHPSKQEIINEESFYLIYNFKSAKEMERVTNLKIPQAIQRIRGVYSLLIHLVKRGKKLKNKFDWTVEQALKWIKRRFHKMTEQDKDSLDFIKDVSLEDETEIIEFLAKDIITWEVLENE
jgi:hypothetical protein